MAGVQHSIATALRTRCLTTAEIAEIVQRPRRQVATITGRLVLSGAVERKERGCFRLTKDGEARLDAGDKFTSGPRGPLKRTRGPRRDRLRQRAWNAMRIKRRFTLEDVLTLAMTGDEKDPLSNLGRYLNALVKAGILSVRGSRARAPGDAPTSNGVKVFRMEKDTGDIAPSVKKTGVFDHNTRELSPWML